MKEEDAPESEDHRECWCCGAPHHAAVSPPGSGRLRLVSGPLPVLSSDCLDELEHDAAPPVRL